MPLPHGRATAVIKTKSAIPVTRQLLTILTKEIEQGAYPAGERFPSERDIAQQYRLSRASVREAVAQMIARGLLVRTNGRGTFVVDRAAGVPAFTPVASTLGSGSTRRSSISPRRGTIRSSAGCGGVPDYRLRPGLLPSHRPIEVSA